MGKKFYALFNRLEAERKSLFKELAGYPDSVLNTKPSPQAWSVVQVIKHLMASEEASLKYLQKKTLSTSGVKPAGFSGKWRLMLTKVIFMVPVKFKAPEIMEPDTTEVSLKELDTQWEKLRMALFELLDKLPENDLDKEIWKHIIAGKMNIYQMLDFFHFHFVRHRKQIERTLAATRQA